MQREPDDGGAFDVLIAGGGLVGGSLAIALAQTDARVALVEAVPSASAAQPSFDDRTIALSHGSCRILQRLGVWELLADAVWPISRIHVSEQGRFGTAVIDAAEQGIAELGHVIKSRALGEALWRRIESEPGITVVCPARVQSVSAAEADVRCVELDAAGTTRKIRTRLLAVADGARSQLRSMVGIDATERDYRQVAIVANLQVDPRHAGTQAYERFTPAGPLAVLPGRDGHYTLVLARATEVAADVLALSDAEFLALVQTMLGFRLGRLQRVGQRQTYPLFLVKTDRLAAPRAVMVGNAAHGLHPVAGQGFNLGLRDVASLAELIADGYADMGAGFDPGAATVLENYAQWRADDQRNVVAFTDGLIRAFGIPGGVVAAGRGLGLTLFDMCPPAKQELARHTMGLAGRMTRLARGLPL